MFDGSSGYNESTVQHEDHLPVETCCAWAKKLEADPATDKNDEDLKALKQACPADVTEETFYWSGDKCVKTYTKMEAGEFKESWA